MALFNSRGFRNNNPFNVKYSERNKWLGQIGSDGVFVRFDKLEYGVRCAIVLFGNYLRLRPMTLKEMLNRFCPASGAPYYYEFVSKRLDVDPSFFKSVLQPCMLEERWFYDFLRAIICYENGLRKFVVDDLFSDDYFIGIRNKFNI